MTTLALTSRHPDAALSTSPMARVAVAVANRIYRWHKIRSDRALLQTMPDGSVELTLGPTGIDGQVLDIQVEGAIKLAKPAPSGSFTITAQGLAAAIAVLQEQPKDPLAQQALGALALVQMYGKPGDNGATIFVIELKEDGSVTVNDQVLKPPTEQAL